MLGFLDILGAFPIGATIRKASGIKNLCTNSIPRKGQVYSMYIACEDANFDWTEEEICLVEELYKKKTDIPDISKRLNRPIEEIVFLLSDRGNKNILDFKMVRLFEKPKYQFPSITKEVYLELKKHQVKEDDVKKLLGIGTVKLMEMKEKWKLNYSSKYPTQEEYEEEKRRGLSDREVCKRYHMSEKTLYRMKRTWGLTWKIK